MSHKHFVQLLIMLITRCGSFVLHKQLFTGVLAVMVGTGSVLFITEAVANPSQVESSFEERALHPRRNTFLKRKWGVEIEFVRLTAAGYMLEFRYKVVDAKKAKTIFERQTKPVLTHTKTGAKLVVPSPAKTGTLRNSNLPKENKVYWMFFANPGKLVQPGDQVSIMIGEFLIEAFVIG